MAITCETLGVKILNCNLCHLTLPENNGIQGVDYLNYNMALDRMFKTGMEGIVKYTRDHMNNLLARTPASNVAGDEPLIQEVIDSGDADPEIPSEWNVC